ncbi:MAG: hypothetical protein HQM15_09810 [Deltaproteobacteria bacterium]|nr:hypothetical protein [Deltaproteobacteria bacterium]
MSNSVFSEVAKKFLMTGLGALSLTEESIRGKLGDLKLPKEAVNFLLDQAKKQKDDLILAVANEVSSFFSRIKVHEEIQKTLTNLNIHVDATISFSQKNKKKDGKEVRLHFKS